jgi:hypothetical protein
MGISTIKKTHSTGRLRNVDETHPEVDLGGADVAIPSSVVRIKGGVHARALGVVLHTRTRTLKAVFNHLVVGV